MATLLTVVAVAASLNACTPKPNGPEPAAEEFFASLAKGDTGGASQLTDRPEDARAALNEAWAGLQATQRSVTIHVTAGGPVNHAPVAQNVSASTPFETPVGVTLVATDADGDPLTYAVGTGPAHGTLSGTAPNLTYTPAGGFSGSDSFTYTANDGQVSSNVATVTIRVGANAGW